MPPTGARAAGRGGLASCSAWRRSPSRRRRATFGTPTADVRRSGPASMFSQPVTVVAADRPGRAAADVRRRDRPDRHRGPEPAGRRAGDADLHARHRRAAAISSRTRRSSPAGGSSPADDPTDVALGPGGPRRLRRRPVRLEDRVRRPRPGPLVRGRRRVRRQGAQDRRGRGPRRRRSCSASPRPSRSTSSSTPTRTTFYDALGPGAHENVGRRGVRRHPDAARAHPARPDRRRAGSAIVIPHELDPPRLRHRRRRTRTTSRRAGSTRAWRSTRARATARPIGALVDGRRQAGHAHPARRADRPVPERPATSSWPTPRASSAVDYMVRTYGSDALVTLIRSYADGRTDDEAFTAALGST